MRALHRSSLEVFGNEKLHSLTFRSGFGKGFLHGARG